MGILKSINEWFGSEVYIDLGTANTLVMEKRRGLVANEPSVVAFVETASGARRFIAVGNEAKRKMGRTSGNLIAKRPLKDGVVADLDSTEAMLKYFMRSAKGTYSWARPRLVVSLPYGVSDVEKKAVRDCGLAAGAREVVLIEEPMAAAIGSGLPVQQPEGSMIIDIGGGTTEVAVIALCGIVHGEAVRVGGNTFDEAIVEYIRKSNNLIVGEQSAERIKIEIGSAMSGDRDRVATIRGVDFASGLPREINISADEIHQAISGPLNEIISAAQRTLEQTPPELLADIIDTGVTVAGGGALLRDIAPRLSQELKVPVRVAEDPLLAIARGGGQAIRDANLLMRIALN